jgi:exopolysaccharide production protein ExoZ
MAEAPAETSRGKLGTLEIGRFIAATTVILNHFETSLAVHLAPQSHRWFTGILVPGAIGVQFFFVLSGFVMMTAHAQDFGKAGAVPKFWWRRFCRIYPMYWIALALPCYLFRDVLTPGLAVKLITLQPVMQVGDYVPPAWSLRYEISFYIAFGLCLLPYVGRPILAAWVVAIFWVSVPLSWRVLLHIPAPIELVRLVYHGYRGFFTFFEFYFFAGLLGGYLYRSMRLSRFAGVVLILLGVCGICVQAPAMQYGFEFGHPMVPAFVGPAFAAVILGLVVLERHGVLRTGRIARWLGMMSYPLYILHAGCLLLYDRQFDGVVYGARGWVITVILGLGVIYAVSAAFTFLVDQPLQRYLRRGARGRLGKRLAAG